VRGRHRDDQLVLAIEARERGDQHGIDLRLAHGRERRVVALGAGRIADAELNFMGLCDGAQVRETPPGAWIEHADRLGLRHRLQEELEALGVELGGEHVDPSDVATGPGETRHYAGFEQPLTPSKRHDNRDGGRLLGRENRGWTHCNNDVDRRADQVRRQYRQPLELVLGRPDLEARRLAVDVAELAQRFNQGRPRDEVRREVPNAPDLRQLPAFCAMKENGHWS